METLNLFSIIVIFAITAMAIVIANKIYKEWRDDQFRSEIKYETQYEAIHKYIEKWPVNKQSYSAIFAELKRLGNMKYKNKEKTFTLVCEFMRKYTEADDEFDCSQLNEEEILRRLKVANEAKTF
jgi:biopolymer transport protein ExbB/TolQ